MRGGKQLKGPKGFRNDVNLNDENGDIVKKEDPSTPNDVIHNDDVNDSNEAPKDPKQSS